VTSEAEWLRVRRELRRRRYELGVTAAELYPGLARVAGTPLLSISDWMPGGPVPLGEIATAYRADAAPAGVSGAEAELPCRADGSPYSSYSDAVGALDRPGLYENRPTYRLLAADLAGAPRLSFGPGRYFDGIDTGAACAHEYAAGQPHGPVRRAIGDPCDPARRSVTLAISVLTLRYDRGTGATTTVLHRRDGPIVGHAADMIQVLPVGVFQPTSERAADVANDLSLWRCMLREYAEELCGEPEIQAPVDYDRWPFAAAMTGALAAGRIRAHALGLGVDPLTLATDLLVAVSIDAPVYDEIFAAAVASNAEGTVLAAVPFTAATVERYAQREPTQAAGAALLTLAWRHRSDLLA
jgi:hypothetical protein